MASENVTNEMLRVLSPLLQRGMDALVRLERSQIQSISSYIAEHRKLPSLPRFEVENDGL